MIWEVEDLEQRFTQGSLLKNNKCRSAKDLLIAHSDINMAYPVTGDPVGIANQDQLMFVINIGIKI